MNGVHSPGDDVLAQIPPAAPKPCRWRDERPPVTRFNGAAAIEIALTLLGAAVAIGVLFVVLPARIPGL